MGSSTQAATLHKSSEPGLFRMLGREFVRWADKKVGGGQVGNFDIMHPPLGSSRAGIMSSKGNVNEMIKAFRSYVFACIHVRAIEVANKGIFQVSIKKANDTLEPAPITHPLVQLMNRPNPRLSKFVLWYLTVTYMDLTGNSYWWVARDKMKIPRALWPVPSQYVKLVPGDPSKGEPIIKQYLIRWDGVNPTPVEAADIVHLKHPDPLSPYYEGGSLVMRAAREVDIADFVTDHWHDFFKNDAMPASVIIFKDAMQEDVRQAFKDYWGKEHRGKAGTMGYIEGEAEIISLTKEHELPFIESRKDNKGIIRSVFGVPESKLMEIESVTAQATTYAVEYKFQSGTIDPFLSMIDQQMTIDLAAELFGDEFVIHHKSSIPSDRELDAKVDGLNLSSGATYINEVRQRQGKDPVEGGDEPLVSAMLVPLSSVTAPPPADTTPAPPPAKALAVREAKSVQNLSESQKVAFWKTHDKFRARIELGMMRRLKKYFIALGYETSDRIRKTAPRKSVESDFLNIDTAAVLASLQEILTNETARTLAAAFEEFIRTYGIEGVIYAPNSPAVHLAIARVNAKTTSIPQTLHDELTNVLDEGIRLQETPELMARRVDRFFSDTADWRSLRIARTVSNYGINEGSRIAAKQAGLKIKIWLTRRDDKVRDPLHTSLDGIQIPIEGKFKLMNGDSLEVPGDPNASKGESVINCRCTALYSMEVEAE